MMSRTDAGGTRALRALALAALFGVAALAGPERSIAQEDGRGWIGIKLSCENECQREIDGAVVWEFSSPPVIADVMPGSPADLAGLRAGDTVLAVNGLVVSSDRGARRLGMLRVGEPVEFRVRRPEGERRIQLVPAPYRKVFASGGITGDVEEWESLRAQMSLLFEEYQQLSQAMRRAEQLWEMTHDDRVRQWADSQQQVLGRFRLQIDSMRREMLSSHRRLADTLALRTLYVSPLPGDSMTRLVPEGRRSGTRPMMTIRAYLNAVAGARFQEVGAELGGYFGVEHGLLVLEVAAATPAETAGLQPGDVIVDVNGDPVRSVSELRSVLRSHREVQLEIVRKGERQTLAMHPS